MLFWKAGRLKEKCLATEAGIHGQGLAPVIYNIHYNNLRLRRAEMDHKLVILYYVNVNSEIVR